MNEVAAGAHAAPLVRVLLVEPDAELALTLARELLARAHRRGIALQLDVSRSFDEASRARGADVGLIEASLPGPRDGVALLEHLRGRRAYRRVAALVMSDTSLDAIAGRCVLLGASVVRRIPQAMLLDCAMKMIASAAHTPRTPEDEIRRYALQLASDAHLSPALADVLARITLDEGYADIASARETSIATVRDQAKAVRRVLAEAGVPLGRDLRASVLAELVRDRDVDDDR